MLKYARIFAYRTDMNLIGRDGWTDGRDGQTDAQTTLHLSKKCCFNVPNTVPAYEMIVP
jgi:hypothetical protein